MQYVMVHQVPNVHADNGGTAVLAPGWIHPSRKLISSVVILGLRGFVDLEVGGEAVQIRPGRIVWLPAGIPHRGTQVLSEPASYYWIHFTAPESPDLLAQSEADTILSSRGVTSHRLDQGALCPLSFDLTDPGPCRDAFRSLLNLQERPAYTPWRFQLQFQDFLIRVTEAVIDSHTPPSMPTAQSSVVYGILFQVAENLRDPNLSIKTIASALSLNLDYAGRRFRQVMGLSVGEYLLKERLKLALRQLEQTSLTLPAIAEACGFGSSRNFLRQFRAIYGLTPTEARTRYQMMHFNSD